MPAVQEYGPLRSSLRPINEQGIAVQATPEAFGASIGRGLQSLAAGVGQVGDAVAAVERIDADNSAKKAVIGAKTENTEKLYGPGGYMNTSGEAAVSGRSAADKVMAETRKKYSDSLSPAARKKYDAIMDQEDASLGATIIQKQGTERRSATLQTSKSLVDTYGQDAVAGYNDPRIRDEALVKGHDEIVKMGELMGWSPETVDNTQKSFSSKTLRGVTMRIAEDDPIAAQKFAEEHKDSILGEDQAYIQSTLKSGVLNEESKREADKILQDEGKLQGGDGNYYNTLFGKESGGRADAKNPDSSATGLAQFTGGTWRVMMATHPELNLTADGRTDPEQSRRAAVAFTKDNEQVLQGAGIEVNNANRYMAHFLGSGGAVKLIRAMKADPTQSAAALMPQAAEANRSIFYDSKTGVARSVSEVYAIQTKRFGGNVAGQPSTTGSSRMDALQAITDPDLRELTMRRLAAMDTAIAAQTKATQDAFKQQLWQTVDAGGTPDDISPEARAAIGMEGVSSAWGYVAARGKRGDVESDETLLYERRLEAARDPQAFAQRNLIDDFGKLSKEARKELTDKQAAAIGDGRKATEDGVTLTTAYSLADAQLRAVGIGIKTRATDQDTAYMEDQQKVVRFQNALTDEMTDFKSRNKVNPTQVEIQAMITRLLMPAIIKRNNERDVNSMNPMDWMGGTDERAGFMFEGRTALPNETVTPNVTIADVPRPFRQSIIETLTRINGKPPSEQEIIDAYVDMRTDNVGR